MTPRPAPPRTPWMQNHALAESETRTGWAFEAAVAEALRAAGLEVHEPPKSWRGSVGQRRAYKNEIDLVVCGRRLSVKSRRVDFTGVEDVPAANDPLFIEGVSKWHGFSPLPWAVVCVSQTTHGMIWLPGSTQAQWGVRKTFDRVRGIPIEVYTAPLALWRPFGSLAGELRCIDDGAWLLRTGDGAEHHVTVRDGYVTAGAQRQPFIALVRTLRELGPMTSQHTKEAHL